MFSRNSNRSLIHDSKQAEQMLRHLGLIAQQAEEGIVIIDLKGKLRFVNTTWAIMHGYDSSSQLVGEPIKKFYTKQQKNQLNKLIEEAKKTHRSKGIIQHLRKDQTEFTTSVKMVALQGKIRKVSAIMMFATDMTKYTQLQQELQELRDKLQQLVNQKTTELTNANEQLIREIEERRQTSDELKQSSLRLERRIEQLTAQLIATNEKIKSQETKSRQPDDKLDEDFDDPQFFDKETGPLNPKQLEELSLMAQKLR